MPRAIKVGRRPILGLALSISVATTGLWLGVALGAAQSARPCSTAGFPNRCGIRGEKNRLQLGRPADPVRELFPLPRPGRKEPRGRPAPRSSPRSRMRAEPGRGKHAIVPGNPAESELIRRVSAENRRAAHAAAVDEQGADAGRRSTSCAMDCARRAVQAALGVHRARQNRCRPSVVAGAASRQRHRSLRPRAARARRAAALAGSRQGDADQSRHPDADRAAADAGGGRRVPRRTRSRGAYEKVVDRLLASPAYGEHMAAYWLNIARYAESDGFLDDYHDRLFWPYRDWVIAAFNRNMPFDQFVDLAAGRRPAAEPHRRSRRWRRRSCASASARPRTARSTRSIASSTRSIAPTRSASGFSA